MKSNGFRYMSGVVRRNRVMHMQELLDVADEKKIIKLFKGGGD